MKHKQKRHRRILEKARILDRFIDEYRKVKKRVKFPHKEAKSLIRVFFPRSSFAGRGAFKTVHRVSSRARDLVLKTSNPANIKNDWRAYHRIPPTLRNRYFAKIYWTTKYCLLQKHGKGTRGIPKEVKKRLMEIGRQFGLKDIRPANIRKVDGHFKIVDANLANRK